MAVTYFDAMLIAPATDLADVAAFPYVERFSRATASRTEIQRLAGGRLRAVTRQGTERRWNLTLQAVTRAQVAWLEGHISTIMLFREPSKAPHAGRKLYGVYREVDASEHLYNHEANVSLMIDEVTWSEAV